MSVARAAWVLLICQAICQAKAEKSRLVRNSVSASGEIETLRTGDGVDYEAGLTRGEELLDQVENMFMKQELDKQDESQINVIKDLVDKELLPDLKKTRDAAQSIINSNLAAIKKCNSDSKTLQTSVKDSTEKTTGTSRTSHAECRAEEEKKNNTKTNRCGQLDTFLDAVNVPQTLPSGRPRDAMVKYVAAMSTYFCPKGPEAQKLDEACKQSEAEHAKHQSGCNKKQAAFELAFCTWRTQLMDACQNLQTCYSDSVKAWKDHVTATQVLVKKWKTEYKALHKIKCYTDVWLNNNDKKTVDASQYEKCKVTEADDKVMEVDPGTAPAKQACDEKPVEIHPGTAKFPGTEYSKFAAFAVTPIACLPRKTDVEVTTAEPTAKPTPKPTPQPTTSSRRRRKSDSRRRRKNDD